MTIGTISPDEKDQVKINGLIKRIVEFLNGVSTFSQTLLALTTAEAWRAALGVRELITANRNYFVATTGSDTLNDGLTVGAPFLTIQKAINVASSLDLGIFAVTINIADGTYTGAVLLKSFTGVGPITLLGNASTPANVLLSVTGAPVINAPQVAGPYVIRGMKLQANSTGQNGINASQLSQIAYRDIDFGTASIHVTSTFDAQLVAQGNTTISAGAVAHWVAGTGGTIKDAGLTITLTGTPAFTLAFAYADQHGRLLVNGNTFSGSATGPRYVVDQLGLIYTGGGGVVYLPGNAAGSDPSGLGYR